MAFSTSFSSVSLAVCNCGFLSFLFSPQELLQNRYADRYVCRIQVGPQQPRLTVTEEALGPTWVTVSGPHRCSRSCMAHMQQPFSSALPASAAGSQPQAGLSPEITPAASIDAPAVPAMPAFQACIEAPPERPPRAAITTQRVPPKRPAPPPPAPAPIAKKARTSPYTEFYQEQRQLLPPGLRNAEREKLLGQMWKALTEEQRAKYYLSLIHI